MSVALFDSYWKRRTSLRKMKSGETLSMKYLRENLLRFHPSIFHVSEVKARDAVEGTEDGRDITEAVSGASTKEVDLSDLTSLNCVHEEEFPQSL